jgi:hypothetical protein
MRNRFPKRQRRSAAGLAGTLTVALALACGTGSTFAEEEDVPLDTKIIRGFLKDLGLQRDGDAVIEYRERAPLVVPPSRDLPPPQSASTVTNNPAGPNDPDVRQRKQEAAAKKKSGRTVSEDMEADARPLSRAELDKGRIARETNTAPARTPEEGARPLRPSELGGKSIFSNMFSSFGGNKAEVGTFTGEPVRENLTAPPPGYQTPSPNQPYGLGLSRERPKAARPEDRLTGETR